MHISIGKCSISRHRFISDCLTLNFRHRDDETFNGVRDWTMERVLENFWPNPDLSIQIPPFPVRY